MNDNLPQDSFQKAPRHRCRWRDRAGAGLEPSDGSGTEPNGSAVRPDQPGAYGAGPNGSDRGPDNLSISVREGLVAFWDFQNRSGRRHTRSDDSHGLTPVAGSILSAEASRTGADEEEVRDTGMFHVYGQPPRTVSDGVFGPYSLEFAGNGMLYLPRHSAGPLAIGGTEANVSVVAWIKWQPEDEDSGECEAIAGVWNEHGLRQYCLFLNLQIHNSSGQVCGHVCSNGGANPGEKYCMDAAIGATKVPTSRWTTVGMSYDGTEARAYLNGILDRRTGLNPYPFAAGLFDGGKSGADFTVGAVRKPVTVGNDLVERGTTIGNHFHGRLGGLAVYDLALTDREMAELARIVSC